MLIALFPVILLVAGLFVWFMAANAKVSEAGKIMFFCGLLVLTFVCAKYTVHVG